MFHILIGLVENKTPVDFGLIRSKVKVITLVG